MAQSRRKRPAQAPTPTPAGRYQSLVPAALLLLSAFVVYAPALGAGFIWDDGRAITDNVNLRSAAGFRNLWAGQGDLDYLPLKDMVLWLIYQLFGPTAAPYHAVNVAVHGVNAILIWHVLRRLGIPGAWLAGLIFLVHPTHVGSVAWVSECKNTLSTMFGLLSLLAWLAYRKRPRLGSYVGSFALFICAVLCKSHIVILPVVLLLCEWWLREPASLKSFRPMLSILPFFLAALVLGAVTVWFQNARAISDFQLPVGGAASRIANAGKATWWYLGKAISPVHPWIELPDRPIESMSEALAVLAGTRSPNPAPSWPHLRLVFWPLCAIYRQWRVTPPVWYDLIPALGMAALFAWSAGKHKGRARGAFFALSYFLVTLLPVLGLFKMSYMRAAWVADHFQYLPDIGVAALVSATGTLLWRRLPLLRRRLLVGAAVVLVGGLAGISFARAAVFRGEYALWTDTVAKNPYAWQAQGRLAAAMMARNDFAGAAYHFAEELRLNDADADGHNNLGLALISQGKVAEGVAHLRASIRLDDRQFFAYANLADALAGERQFTEAAAEYRSAIRRQPSLAPLHFRLADALIEIGQYDEAIAALEKADTLAPNHREIAAALGKARQRGAARGKIAGPSEAVGPVETR